MKRNIKNIIMIILVFVVVGCTIFTMYCASKSVSTNNMGMPNGNEMNSSNQGTPPDKPEGNGEDNQSSETNTNGEDKSDTNSENTNQNTPPEKPDDNGSNENTPPDKPEDNDNNQGTPPDMANNQNNMVNVSNNIETIYYVIFCLEGVILGGLIIYLIMSKFNKNSFKDTFSNRDKVIIYVLSIVIISGIFTYGSGYISSKNNFKNNNINNNGNSNTNVSYNAVKEIKTSMDLSDSEYETDKSDTNVIMVSGDVTSNLSSVKVTKSGDSDGGDNTSFYGNNSAIIAKDGAIVNIDNADISTDATGANGVFSYGGYASTNNSTGDGTTINISNSKIVTSKDNSGGIMTTGGGIMNASNLDITTNGVSSAAIRTDRGGGTVSVDGGTYTTNGAGSPSIYSTASITVKNSKLISNASEGIVIEGKNSVSIENTELIDTNNKLNGKSTTYKNIFLYQSMSGDASVGISTFSAKNSKITTNNGDTFYVTNTNASITLENNEIVNNDSNGNFLRISKDSWGTSGSNGGEVELILNNQKALGNILVDSISTLNMSLSSNSYYDGIINGDNSAKEIKLSLDKSSSIKLEGDCYITSLDNEDTSNSNIDFNGYKLYVNGSAVN